MEILLLVVVFMGVMIFMQSRTRKKQAAAAQQLRDAATVGARVQTTSGIFGTIVEITDRFVDLEIATGIVVRWDRRAIVTIVTEDAGDTYVGVIPADELEDDDDDDEFDFEDADETTEAAHDGDRPGIDLSKADERRRDEA